MNSYLISSFHKIWLKVEKVNDTDYYLYFVNNQGEKVRAPNTLDIINDNKGTALEKYSNECYKLNNIHNHSIFYNNKHILDFSHNRLWCI
jgi:hypothetical protein